MDSERYTAAAEAVKSQVETLLGKSRAFAPTPMGGGAADPAAPSGATTGVESLAGDGDVQGWQLISCLIPATCTMPSGGV